MAPCRFVTAGLYLLLGAALCAIPGRAGPEPGEGDGRAVWRELLEGNRRFAAGVHKPHLFPEERKRLAKEQHPKAIVVCCSDSRVPPELLFDAGLGDLFVIRVAGNVADPVAIGSVEYAVEHLHAPLLLVLGHERCGAVHAAVEAKAHPGPAASGNLAALVGKILPSLVGMAAKPADPEKAELEGVAANVHHTRVELLGRSGILKKAVAERHLAVVEGLYHLESGLVEPLE